MRGGHANELQSTPCVIHDGSEHRQAAGAFAEAVIRSVELIVQPDADDKSCRSWKK
jgi:hypothetical protein